LARPCGIRFRLARLGNPWAVVLAMIALLMATLNVNVAANVVSPANDFSNLSPRRIGFRHWRLDHLRHGYRHAAWKLMADYGSYIFGWLVGYSGFLGPIAAYSSAIISSCARKSPRRGSLSAPWAIPILARFH